MCLTSVLYSITMHCGPFQLATTQNLSFKLKIVDVFHTNMSTKILLHCMCTEVCTDIIDSDNRSTQYTVFCAYLVHTYFPKQIPSDGKQLVYNRYIHRFPMCIFYKTCFQQQNIITKRIFVTIIYMYYEVLIIIHVYFLWCTIQT